MLFVTGTYCFRRCIVLLFIIANSAHPRPGQIFPIFASISPRDPWTRTLGQYACVYIKHIYHIIIIIFRSTPTPTCMVRVFFGLPRIPYGSVAYDRCRQAVREQYTYTCVMYIINNTAAAGETISELRVII